MFDRKRVSQHAQAWTASWLLHDTLDHWRIFKVNTFTEGVSKFILGSHNTIHSLINGHRVRFLPCFVKHVRVDPMVVSVGQLGWIVLEAGHHHVTTDRLALRRQELDLRGVAFASDGVALAVVVRGEEVKGRKDGDLVFRLGLHELLMNGVEEVRTCGVQVVPEIPPSVLFQVIDGQLEEGMPSAAGYEPVEYVDLRLFSDDEGMLVRLLADQTVIMHSPVVQRFERVHVKVEVDPAVSMEHKVSHDVRSEDGRGVAVVKDQVAWIVTRHKLTDIIQRPEPILPVWVQRLPGLHPFLVSARNLIRVPNLSSQKKNKLNQETGSANYTGVHIFSKLEAPSTGQGQIQGVQRGNCTPHQFRSYYPGYFHPQTPSFAPHTNHLRAWTCACRGTNPKTWKCPVIQYTYS